MHIFQKAYPYENLQIKAITYYRNEPSTLHDTHIEALSPDDAKFRFTQLQQGDPFWHSTTFQMVEPLNKAQSIMDFLNGFKK